MPLPTPPLTQLPLPVFVSSDRHPGLCEYEGPYGRTPAVVRARTCVSLRVYARVAKRRGPSGGYAPSRQTIPHTAKLLQPFAKRALGDNGAIQAYRVQTDASDGSGPAVATTRGRRRSKADVKGAHDDTPVTRRKSVLSPASEKRKAQAFLPRGHEGLLRLVGSASARAHARRRYAHAVGGYAPVCKRNCGPVWCGRRRFRSCRPRSSTSS
jgi:hypothetical protein